MANGALPLARPTLTTRGWLVMSARMQKTATAGVYMGRITSK
jgi:hypothetical protein